MVSSLSDLCIAAVVKSFDSICCKKLYTRGSKGIPSALYDGDGCYLTFPDVFLPPAVADVLLESVLRQCRNCCPKDLFMWLHPFLNTRKCRLTRVALPRLPDYAVGFSPRAVQHVLDFILCRLAEHTLTELSIDPSWRIDPSTISKMLSEENPSTFALKILNMRNLQFPPRDGSAHFAHLRELRVLNISGTGIVEAEINILLKNMRNLEVLELAQVSFCHLDLSPVAGTLRYLNVQDMDSRFVPNASSTFKTLRVLQHLDLSFCKSSPREIPNVLIDLMISMPTLQSVDLSRTFVYPGQVEALVNAKGVELKFLGLWGAPYVTAPCAIKSDIYPDHLMVTGMSTVKQIVATLQTQRYHILDIYMTECLREMFKYLRDGGIDSGEVEIVQTIILLLKMHSDNYPFLLAASACLIHLYSILWRDANRHNTSQLQRVCVDQILLLLESPKSYKSHLAQLHINCYIFLSVAGEMICVEKYELERVAHVMVSNCRQYDSTVMRMRVLRVLRSVVYNLDTEGRTIVGQTGVCSLMKDIVSEKLADNLDDEELTHALSTIWSLTDENVSNCCLLASETFVHEMLSLFKVCTQHSTQLKIHGGLGNLLEVPSCRMHLMRDDYCSQFVDMLRIEETPMELKFESAHAFVNLAMEGEETWGLNCISYRDALQLVKNEIREWPIPSDLRCAYRTFKSQLSLLEESDVPAIHLYSLWTIANFCYYDDDRYVPMLITDQGIPIINKFVKSSANLLYNPGVPWSCQSLAFKIMKAVEDKCPGSKMCDEH